MKKINALGLVFLLSISFAFAQKVIENPVYEARNNPIVDIAKIELRDTATVFYCNATYRPNFWIKVPATTYIQSSEGGEKLGISSTEGITIDEEFHMPASGKTSFIVYFPPIDPAIPSIDFIECPESNCFNFYDIRLGEGKSKKTISSSVVGEWFAPEGAGEWSYAFYDEFAVYKDNFWEYGSIRENGRLTEITLKRGSESEILYAKNAKDGSLLLGSDKKNLLSYTRKRTSNLSYDYTSKNGFAEDSFIKGNAVIRGFIKGHSPKMGLDEGNAVVQSVFSWEGTNFEFKIDSTGRFEVMVPLSYPGIVQLDFERARTSIFVEPGSKNLMVFELDEFTRTYLSTQDYSNRTKTTLFMGDNTAINNDLQMYSDQFTFNDGRLMKAVAESSPEQYKAIIKNQLKERLKILNELKETKKISIKAYQYFENTIKLSAISDLLEYNLKRRHVKLRADENIPDSLRTPFEEVELDIAYFDLMKEIVPDYQMGLLSDKFLIFIDRANYFKEVGVAFTTEDMDRVEEVLKAKGQVFSQEEQELKGMLASLENKTAIDETVMSKYSSLLESFHKKYSSIVRPLMAERQTEARIQNIKKYLGIKDGLVLDITRAQNKINLMEQYYLPMSEEELHAFNKQVGTQFVKDHVNAYNAEVIRELATEVDMSGVVVNEAPAVEPEDLFDTMMEKYKGKVVYIDFWATWCGPCIWEMPYSKKLKEELKGKNVVFVYLTNETSPLKTWTNKIPDMKGEHFRLKPEEWEILSQKFKVRGIPHYLLVDQEGKLVAENATRPSQKDKLKGEINDLLDN